MLVSARVYDINVSLSGSIPSSKGQPHMKQHTPLATKPQPLPSHPPIRAFNLNTTVGSKPPRDIVLEEAAIDFWHAFNPRPIRMLNHEDLHLASQALEIWEQKVQSGIPKLTELRAYKLSFLVLDMLQVLKRVILIPKLSGDAHKSLKSRIQDLILDIYAKILQEKRSTTRARDLLAGLSEHIGTNLLNFGEHPILWATAELPFIIELLEAWTLSELSPDVSETGILGSLQGIYLVPCLPIVSVSQNLRSRAFKLFKEWSLVLNIPLRTKTPDPTPDNVEWRFIDVGTLAHVLQSLENAAGTGDTKNLRIALQRLQHFVNIDMDVDLVFTIRKSFSTVYELFRKSRSSLRPAEVKQIRLQMKLLTSEDLRFNIPQFYSLRPANAASQIMIGQAIPQAGSVITFVKAPFEGYSYEYVTPEPDNGMVFTCISLDIPAQVLFDLFVAKWNQYNRHPLWPLVTFELQHLCKLSPTLWCQGSLESALKSISRDSKGSYEICFRVIRNNSFEERKSQQISTLMAWERIVACATPSTWISPSLPRHPTSWMQVPTLSFVGSGSEIHPHMSYPPILASHIWVPKQWEELGLNPRYLTQRIPCAKISVSTKKSLLNGGYLSREEAQSLVGRTVQFAIEVPINGMATTPFETKSPASRDAIGHVVHVSFIWGFDPNGMILRGIERDNTERCRSFFVGDEKRYPLVDDRITWRNANRNELEPIRPIWIGAVETSGERPRSGSSQLTSGLH
ncbi:hypothetical protein D9758_008512 [Tetrapyrgos nigripes]|uniref:Uncharacterized protein n=1 Tax=Tetrapyrgos nigripes TaxID=182062 RepID=A0A8H5FPZ1_9AGAR|nr:hypothetical protein D9758_008512 [Tetrapyrgos nigripes]